MWLMKNLIHKIAEKFDFEIIESDYEKKGINSYKIDEKGNVINLFLNQIAINEISVLLPFSKSLKVLTLFECGIENIEDIVFFKELKELDLTLNSISKLTGLESLTSLKKLVLPCVYMDSISELKYLKEIEILNLSSNIEINFDNEFEGLDNLKELNLSGNDLVNLNNICPISSLKKLNLKECEITHMDGIEKFPNLEVLNLSGNPIEEITGLVHFINLKELYLNSTNISEISGLDSLVNLESLDLSDTKIYKIQGLTKLISLKELNLSYTEIEKIEGLIELNKLEVLMLINTEISVIENLPISSLKILHLEGNRIKNVNYDLLKSINQHCFINLSNNPIEVIIKNNIPKHITIKTKDSDGVPMTL